MAELIPSQMGQDMAQAGTVQPNPVQQAQQQADSQPVPHDQAQGSENDPRTVGSEGQRREQDPGGQHKPTPEEEAQYVDFMHRFKCSMNDPRRSDPNKPSPLEVTLDNLNMPNAPVAKAVGFVAAQQMFIVYDSAAKQKVKYKNDVVFACGYECVADVYLLGLARNIFKGLPPLKVVPAEGQGYDFSDQDMAMISHALIFATERFGHLLQSHGYISNDERAQATQFWEQNIKREINSGKVDDKMIAQLMRNPKIAEAMHGVSQQGNENGNQ